ncbi:hypothetical protein [Haliangium sp.]|uniref:hypothetical protein n=1 Tax=Haliangium sp. TaxID=2663208 RepID=UPI003D09C3E0
MKTAQIYLRKGKLLVGTLSRTEFGVWVVDGPYSTMAMPCESEVVGTSVIAAIERSRNVPHPRDPTEKMALILSAAGVKSWGTFVKGAKEVLVDLDGAQYIITPTSNQGARGGFTPLIEKKVRISSAVSPAQLGEAVFQGIELGE